MPHPIDREEESHVERLPQVHRPAIQSFRPQKLDDATIPPKASNDFVRLTDAGSHAEANMIRQLLKDNQIYCFVKGENHSALLGEFGATMIGYDIMVKSSDLSRAQTLVADFFDAEPIWDDAEPEDQNTQLETLSPRAIAIDTVQGKSVKTARLLALIPSFGFGHFYTGAFQRGGMLALTEMIGIGLLLQSPFAGIFLILLAITVDFTGAGKRVAKPSQRPPKQSEI